MKTKTIKLNLAWLIAFLSRGRILLRVCGSDSERGLVGEGIPTKEKLEVNNQFKKYNE
jgi:hypothetical protein